MKQWAINCLNRIQDNWMDQRKVAKAYSRYITSKAQVMTDLANSTSRLIIEDIDVSGYYETGDVTGIPQDIVQTLERYGTSVIVNEDGQIASVQDLFTKVSNLGENSLASLEINTVSGTTVKAQELIETMANYVNNSLAISTALDSISEDLNETKTSVSDYLSTLQAKLGSAYPSIASNATSYWQIINQKTATLKDKVAAMLNSVTSVVQNIDDRLKDDTQTFQVDIDNNEYTGASVTGAWATGAGNVFSTTWNVVKVATKTVVSVLGGLLSLGAKAVGKLWNKYVKPVYNPNDFVINENYDEDYFSFPLCQYKFTLSDLNNATFYSNSGATTPFSMVLEGAFGHEFNNFQVLWDEISDNTGYCIETNFAMYILSKVVDGNDSYFLYQIFLRPSPAIENPLHNSCLVHKWSQNSYHDNRSLHEQFDLLFSEEDTTNVKIDSDIAAANSLLASRFRAIFLAGILALAYDLDDELWETKCNESDQLNTGAPWVRYFGIAFCQETDISDSNSTFVGFIANSCRSVKKFQFTSEPSNQDFCALIDGYGANANSSGSMTAKTLSTGIELTQIAAFGMMIMGNSYPVMKAVFSETGDFPTFFPYTTRTGYGNFRYTINTDAQNQKAANTIATVLVSAIAIVAIAVTIGIAAFKISKGLAKKALQVEALGYAYEDAVTEFGVNSNEANLAFKNFSRMRRRTNLCNKIASMFGITAKYTYPSLDADIDSKSGNAFSSLLTSQSNDMSNDVRQIRSLIVSEV